MSITAINAVRDRGPTSTSSKLLLIVIASRLRERDPTGWAFPGIETLARDAAMSVRTVQRTLAQLEADGWLEVRRGGGKGNASRYRLRMEKLRADDREQNPVTVTGLRVEPRHPDPETPSNATVNPATVTGEQVQQGKNKRGGDITFWDDRWGPRPSELAMHGAERVVDCEHRAARGEIVMPPRIFPEIAREIIDRDLLKDAERRLRALGIIPAPARGDDRRKEAS